MDNHIFTAFFIAGLTENEETPLLGQLAEEYSAIAANEAEIERAKFWHKVGLKHGRKVERLVKALIHWHGLSDSERAQFIQGMLYAAKILKE